eukprot:8384785-Lingulodinium_polyedra.AAC.1
MQAMDCAGGTASSNACGNCEGQMFQKRSTHVRTVAVVLFDKNCGNALCAVDRRLCLYRPWHARLA